MAGAPGGRRFAAMTRAAVRGVCLLLICVAGAPGIAEEPAPVPQSALKLARQQLHAALETPADRERGAQLFTICAACHGAGGGGDVSGWPPEIAGQHRRVLAKELVDFRTGVRWYDPMERIAGRHVLHTTQEIADVAAYVSSLTPSAATTPGNGRWLAQGASLYGRLCASCHGAQGEGSDAGLVPRVAGQQFEYLQRQLYDAIEERRPNMQGQHQRLLKGLGREDLAGIADYMARLPRPENPGQ